MFVEARHKVAKLEATIQMFSKPRTAEKEVREEDSGTMTPDADLEDQAIAPGRAAGTC